MSICVLMLLDAVDQPLRKLAELAILQKAPLDETANLIGGHPGILLDLVQDLEGDLTASGSSRHDQVASTLRAHGNGNRAESHRKHRGSATRHMQPLNGLTVISTVWGQNRTRSLSSHPTPSFVRVFHSPLDNTDHTPVGTGPFNDQ